MQYHIVSIGAMERNPLWNEREPVRTGHATTTLIVAADKRILVDPGLPPQVLEARLNERVNMRPADITDIFLTSFRRETTRGIRAFDHATWWVNEAEREGVGVALISELARASDAGEQELVAALEQDVAVLRECKAAPDVLAEGVDLFPLPGVSPGLCGLILAMPRFTLVIAGDAIPMGAYLERGEVPNYAADVDKARESFADVVEVADLVIPGRDHMVVNPTRRPF